VLAQPGGVAWNVYDERLHRLGFDFPDYREAVALGAVKSAATVDALAHACGLPADALQRTLDEVRRCASGEATDRFGRSFAGTPAYAPPFHACKVTGALFHTQGGLLVDAHARVLTAAGGALPNLFAGGGAACGVSGAHVWGYLSGNGLLAATTLGRLAGDSAARLTTSG
jgi:fumarate reductase flavoprotein subunit